MSEEDTGVAMQRWARVAGTEDVGEVIDDVCAFAGRHGMQPAQRRDLVRGLEDVLVLVGADAATLAAAQPVAVDAATDGTWLTVRFAGPGGRGWSEHTALARVEALADRVEWSSDGAGGAIVLLELPMEPPAGQPLAASSSSFASAT